MHYLLEWVQNGHAERYIKEVLQHLQPYNSPSYWPAIYCLVLQGRVNDVRELLAQHPDRQAGKYDAFASMDELLHKMPMYQLYMGQSLAEFTMKWSHWQQECKHCLDNETYAGNEHLQKICQIIPGCQGLAGYWVPGSGILVHKSDIQSRVSQGSEHCQIPVLHEVQWGADFF